MQGTRKADIDVMKGFLSRQVDEYRAAYGRVVERHPRTSIICGTTNSTTGFLRDTTGNRRFWPVTVNGGGRLNVWGMTEETRAQIWVRTASWTLNWKRRPPRPSRRRWNMTTAKARSATIWTRCCLLIGTAGAWTSAWTTSGSGTSWIQRRPRARCNGREYAPERSSASASDGQKSSGKDRTATKSQASWQGSRSGKMLDERPGSPNMATSEYTHGGHPQVYNPQLQRTELVDTEKGVTKERRTPTSLTCGQCCGH